MERALIALLVAVLAVACGRGREAPAEDGIRLQVSGDPAELDAYRALIDAYGKAHPGRKVTLLPVGKQKDHMAKLATSFAAGDPPELFILNFRRFGQFAERGALEPLGPALAADGRFRREDFFEPAVEAFETGGAVQCVPQNVSSLVVYWNKSLFKAAGVEPPSAQWSVREFTDKAQKLTRDTDGDKRVDVYGLGIEPTLIRIAPFIWGIGADLVNDRDNPSHLALDRPLPLRALAYVKQLNVRYGVVPPLAAHQAEKEEARFARGGLGMLLESRRYTATLRHLKLGFEWDVAAFPTLAQPASALHADGYCLARGARNRAQALDFAAFALGEEGQTLLARTGRTVPSRKSVAQGPAFLDPSQAPASAQVFLDAIPQLERTPNVAVWHEVETKADAIIEEWFYEPPLPGGGEAGEAGAEGRDLVIQLRAAVNPVLLKSAHARAAEKAR